MNRSPRRARTPLAPFALALAAFGAAADDGAVTPVWEASDGLVNPESVLHDAERGVLYVSDVNGDPTEKDGEGAIARMSLDGREIEADWVTGLDAPKGLALVGDRLYVSDITALVEIDVGTGEVTRRFEVPEAKFLNDVAADADGRVYVSDMLDDKLYRLVGDTFDVWIDSPDLESPNGLFVDGTNLVVGSWGRMTDGFATAVPGHLKTIPLDGGGEVATLGDGTPVGNLDGVESDGRDGYLVSDWLAGAVFDIAPDGSAERLLDLDQGSADIEVMHEEGLLLVPMMNSGKVVAYLRP